MSKSCIFCGKTGNKSKEHLWPVWMHKYLPIVGDGENIRENNTFQWKQQIDSKIIKRQGHLTTTKFRVVCKTCNSGWMSMLEEEAKPILTRILNKEDVVLTCIEQNILAKWIVMKVIVGEHADNEIYVTPELDRFEFREKQKIPDYYAVYIGTHKHNSDSAWLRISQTMALSPTGPTPPLNGLSRNAQTVAFICGTLYVFVISIREKGIDPTKFFNLPKLVRLFPQEQKKINFPMQIILSSHDMGIMS